MSNGSKAISRTVVQHKSDLQSHPILVNLTILTSDLLTINPSPLHILERLVGPSHTDLNRILKALLRGRRDLRYACNTHIFSPFWFRYHKGMV